MYEHSLLVAYFVNELVMARRATWVFCEEANGSTVR